MSLVNGAEKKSIRRIETKVDNIASKKAKRYDMLLIVRRKCGDEGFANGNKKSHFTDNLRFPQGRGKLREETT